MRQQSNIEEAISQTALELEDAKGLPDREPEPDWVVRWFSCVQDVSSEQVRQLWARILAGEIKAPGSFSLWTLDALRNFSQFDAECFQAFAGHAVEWKMFAFVPRRIEMPAAGIVPSGTVSRTSGRHRGRPRKGSVEEIGGPTDELLTKAFVEHLMTIGLIGENLRNFPVLHTRTKDALLSNGKQRALYVKQIRPPVVLDVVGTPFTSTGKELLQLVEDRGSGELHLSRLKTAFEKVGLDPFLGRLVHHPGVTDKPYRFHPDDPQVSRTKGVKGKAKPPLRP